MTSEYPTHTRYALFTLLLPCIQRIMGALDRYGGCLKMTSKMPTKARMKRFVVHLPHRAALWVTSNARLTGVNDAEFMRHVFITLAENKSGPISALTVDEIIEDGVGAPE